MIHVGDEQWWHSEWKDAWHEFAALDAKTQAKLAPFVDKIYELLKKESQTAMDLHNLYIDDRNSAASLRQALGVEESWLKDPHDKQNVWLLERTAYYRRFREMHPPSITIFR